MNKILGMALAGAGALALAACGSSGGDETPVTPTPPPAAAVSEIPSSAQQTPAGLAAFANAQVSTSSDSAEPLVIGDATLPTDDTTETSL